MKKSTFIILFILAVVACISVACSKCGCKIDPNQAAEDAVLCE